MRVTLLPASRLAWVAVTLMGVQVVALLATRVVPGAGYLVLALNALPLGLSELLRRYELIKWTLALLDPYLDVWSLAVVAAVGGAAWFANNYLVAWLLIRLARWVRGGARCHEVLDKPHDH